MDRTERAKRLQVTVNTPGWADAMAILAEMAQEPRDEVFQLMARNPDKLTGKTAIKNAARAQGLDDFREAIQDELKILLPTRKGGAQE